MCIRETHHGGKGFLVGESPTLPGSYRRYCQVCIMHFPHFVCFVFILFYSLSSAVGCLACGVKLVGDC